MGITVQRARDVVIERVDIVGSGIIAGELHAVIDAGEDSQEEVEETRLRGDGIWLFDSERTVVRDSTIETVRDGVQLTYGSGCRIENVRVSDSRYALHDMYAADAAFIHNDLRGNLSGIVLMYGGPVRVEGNTITENGSASTGFGVLVKDAGGVLLRDNVIADNRVAVHIDDAGRTGGQPALLERNTIAVNQIGVLLFPSADSSFTDNGFVENTTQVALGGSGYTQAVWTVDGVGNYWSDYGGFDAEGDGTGDLAYERSGRTSQLIAEDPMLLALASGPAFRLLSVVEERWAPSDPLVWDDAPQISLSSPPLAADRMGARAPLWLPGALMTAGCGWLLVRARRHRGGVAA
jgi:nitrous oxidase accessory protein